MRYAVRFDLKNQFKIRSDLSDLQKNTSQTHPIIFNFIQFFSFYINYNFNLNRFELEHS